MEPPEISHDEAKIQLHDLFDANNRILDLILWIADCPFSLDQATIPKNGIEINPKQVVGNMSMSYLKYKELCDIAEYLKNELE